MPERIKGLQIDLSMKDMGVQRSISEIKRSFKGLNADLKLSNNNFKYSEKSLNSYKLRTRELSQAVKESKANVAALKAKYQEAARASGVNSKKAAQLRQEYSRQADNLNYLQNELDQTRDKYREMIAVSKSSVGRLGQTFSEIGPKIRSIGDSMKSVGRNMSLHVTAPIAAGFGAAVKKSIDFDDTMRKVKATSGATGDEFNQLRTKALQMGRDTKFTASESAEAMNYMALAGWDTKDMLKGVGGVMDLAAASGEDLASVSDIVTDNLTAFGMKAKDSTHFADVLAQTSSKANTDVRGLGEAFKYAAPVAGALGYSVEDTSIAIGLMSNAGIKGEKAGTALRTMFTNLSKPTKAMKDEMDKLGISITDSNGEMLPMRDVMDQLRNKMGGLSKDQQAAAASTIFGKEAMSGALAVINASDEDYKKLTKSIDGSKGASKRMAKEMEGGIGGAMRKMKSAIESLAISLGDALAPMLYKAAKWITSLANKFSNLPTGVQKTIAVVGLLAAAIGPLLMVFGVMVSTIGTAITALGSLMTSMRTLSFLSKTSAAATGIWNGVTATARGIANGYRLAIAALSTSQTIQALKTKIAAAATTAWTAVTKGAALATKGLGLAIRFMTGPVGIVITAIGLLVAGLIHLWKTNSSFRNSVINAWNAIKNAAVAIFGFIKPYIINIWNAIKNSTIAIWNAIKKSAVIIWNAIKFAVQHPIQALKNVLSALWNGMKNASIKIWNALKNGVIAIIKAYVAQVRFNINLIKRIVVTIFNAIKSFSIKVWTALKKGVLGIIRALRKGVLSVFNALKKGVSVIFNAVKNVAVKIWTAIKKSVVNKAKALWSGVKNIWNALKKGTIGIFKAVGSFMSSKWNSIKKGTVNKSKALWSGVKDAWGSLKKGTHNTMSAVGGFMSKKWNGIKSTTASIVNSMKSKVMGVMNKMGSGIKTVTGKIGNFFGGMVKGVKKGLNKLIGGVNWVAGKLGMDKLPKIKLSTGTESTHTQRYITNGKLNRSTLATVGDKGKGNGPNGFRHETIIPPKGKPFITPNKDTTMPLQKGTRILNGAQTHAMINQPQFSTGTIPKFSIGTMIGNLIGGGKKPKKHKHKDANDSDQSLGSKLGDMWGGVKNIASQAIETGKGWAKTAGKAAGKAIGDVLDYIEKPGKLVEKVFDIFGIGMKTFGIPSGAELPFNMMKGMFGKLKNGAIAKVKDWLEEAGGGDGGYIKYLDNITTPYSPNGPPPGYAFSWPHPGIDLPYHYEKVQSTISGTAHTKEMPGGFGHYISVIGGALEVIYGHLSKWLVKNGEKVHPGTVLGVSGNTGASTGPHLHYEMHKHGKPIDPVKWLKSHNGGGKSGGSRAASAWRPEVIKALRANHLPTSGAYVNAWIRQIASESSGNAGARQGVHDVNSGGNEAQGLVQVTPSTFRAFKMPGHGNILNGLDNLMAGIHYAKSRYGSSMLGVIGHGHGYATGGLINSSGWYNLAEDGYPEIVIPTDPSRQSDAMKLLHLAASKISGNNRNKRPNQLRTPSVTSNTVDNAELLLQMIENQQKQINVLMEIARSNETIEKQPKGFSERDVSQAQGSRLRLAAYSQGGL
ncbi:phage tail tape measure protein [Staphylococcus capitis]|uniref:phage tail tape measure protein n=1 Tax=Staphylococcus capitis TaxID=29388 RepID=UPI001D15C711|nr:phage tail tape measure protein [Staphylococcus capitis]MCC3755496.1 phage tail tape measure protein [Staphylococcus capitis]MDH8729588.1 phage tail tape measure protein [Staphylococcus capitis]MDH8729651.1 phage tail tape measure protein [Staphylococcus capitis]MDH8923471.1 phage tail tape measure protein [Staphylococcus capitis]MDH8944510.1 phage tail tape measure protein [Staphylococcus capitis]